MPTIKVPTLTAIAQQGVTGPRIYKYNRQQGEPEHITTPKRFQLLLIGVVDWLDNGVAYHHAAQKKTLYFKRGTFSAKIDYSKWPEFIVTSLTNILLTHEASLAHRYRNLL